MNNTNATKRKLTSSVLAMIVCIAMLIGTTFAWFTDSASTGVNNIQAGELKVQLLDKNGNDLEGQTLTWQKAAGHENDAVLWEPGCTYDLQQFKIKNNGNLALKYKITITGIDGDAELNDAIDWTYTLADGTYAEEGELLADAETGLITISGHMKESAGNEYQGMTIDGIGITVAATQLAHEYDSFDNQYDAAAPADPVSSQGEVSDAMSTPGSSVIVTAADNTLTLGNNTSIAEGVTVNLGGTTQAIANSIKAEDGQSFDMSNGELVKSGSFGVIRMDAKGDEQVCTFEKMTFTDTEAPSHTGSSSNDTEQMIQICPDGSADTIGKYVFRNCTFNDAMVGIAGMNSGADIDVVFEGCTFNNTGNKNAIDINSNYLTGSLTVKDCTFNLVTTSNINAIYHWGSKDFSVDIDTITVNGSIADSGTYNLFGTTSVKAYTVGSHCTVNASNVTVNGIATEN